RGSGYHRAGVARGRPRGRCRRDEIGDVAGWVPVGGPGSAVLSRPLAQGCAGVPVAFPYSAGRATRGGVRAGSGRDGAPGDRGRTTPVAGSVVQASVAAPDRSRDVRGAV